MSRPADRYCGCGARLARDNPGTTCSACQRQDRVRVNRPPTVPPEFWSAEPIRNALRDWHIGKVIAAYRAHEFHQQTLSQELVAGWLGITQAQLSRIENGDPVQDLGKLVDWARLLGIPPELLWFKLPGAADDPAAGGAAPSRRLIRLTGDAAKESLRFARATTDTGLASETLEHLQWEIECLANDYVHAPLQAVFADLVTVRNAVFELLSARHRPRDARQLYLLAGIACDLLAQGSNDAGNSRAARAQLRTAWTCAQMCDNDALKAWLHGTAALVEEWADNAQKSLQLALRGRRYHASRRTRIRLAAIEARAAARLGHRERVNDAMARLVRAQDERQEDDAVVIYGGTLTFPEAKQHFYIGRAHGLIGEHDNASRASRQAIDAYAICPADERSYGDEALARVDVVNALISAGDLEAAGEAAAPIIELPVSMRIGPLDNALDSTRLLLNDPKFAGAKAIVELRDRLTNYQEENRDHRQLLAAVS